ncbi:hypothetical protein GCM10010172_21710 [Paractinoplanes ferrugineus]|uniref:Pyrrolo-quinoline quinone repeat domain-containing protein n=1 Tax=Paractinoplanes ferrugineus TaxID=113564 RepID=A0A919IVJ8_9ACTN|nr:PQQ-binding-like beta-propeller repeat protein [Actinoplanes ferrugineus]GIE08918.1 hypothetical protein Afe05nite_07580 [Actinoplanes ferrugineus]
MTTREPGGGVLTTIDLGEVGTDETAPPPAPLDIPRLRRVALAVLALVGAFALAGSAPADTTGVHQLWATPLRQGEAWSLSADTAYVTRSDKVSAYNLVTGELRWSVPARTALGGRKPQRVGDLLLVPADPVMISDEEDDGSRSYYETVHTTIALEAATGDERWRVDGATDATETESTTLVADDDEQARTVRLRLIRLADGAVLWSRSTPATVSWTPIRAGGRTVAFGTVTQDGLVDVYDYASGRLRHSMRLPGKSTKQRTNTLLSADGYLVVMRDQMLDTESLVYSAADFRLLWRTSGDAGYVTTCGHLLCSVGPTGIAGHDPLTGRTKWELAGVRDLWPAGPDRIMVSQDERAGGSFLLDPATGARIGAPVPGRVAYPQEAGEVPMFLRGVVDPPGRTAVIAIDPADGAQRMLGAVADVTNDDICRTTSGYLACVRDSTLDITAVG